MCVLKPCATGLPFLTAQRASPSLPLLPLAGDFLLSEHGGEQFFGNTRLQQALAEPHRHGVVREGIGKRQAEKAAVGRMIGALGCAARASVF